MSFLVKDDDKSTLDEALAFIDSYGDSSLQSLDTTDDSSGVEVPFLDDLVDSNSPNLLDVPAKKDANEKKPKPKKRRIRSAETTSTALQRRKRAELASLREQVEELQEVLAQLKRSEVSSPLLVARDRGGTVSAGAVLQCKKSGRSPWYEQATEQYKLRLQSEKTNRHLKAIMTNQKKVRKSLCGVLQKRSVLYGMDFVMRNEVPDCSGLLRSFGLADTLMTELEDTVEGLHRRANAIFATQLPTSLSSTMHTQYDEQRNCKVLKFETSTPLRCSLQHAKDFLWKDFQASRTAGRQSNSLQKKILLTMQSHTGAIHAEKLHFVRRFDEEEQMLISWADIMALPSRRELRYRTEGWILVTRSTTDPFRACLARSFLKLYLDAAGTVSREDLAYAQDIVLGAMAMKLRDYWQSVQNMLLEEASQVLACQASV